MFDTNQSEDIFGMSGALEALSDLERNTSSAIIAQRSSQRMDLRTSITIRPGNASDRYNSSIQGMTCDISNGGTKVLSPRPVMPGDIFWITFDEDEVRIGSLLARCMRCSMVQEDTFEVGYRFLDDIDLASALVHHVEEQLI